MKVKEVKISELKPYDKNAKIHPKKQIDLLVENIKRFGFTTPCLIDKDKNIIAGHGRLEAVKVLEWEKVPCVIIDYLTEKEIQALRIADNKLTEMGEWDMNLLIGELKGLDELIDLTGFDKDLIIEGNEKDDEVPEVPEEPKSKLGDLYELGNHRVLCEDATKKEDVERLMDGKKADMVFTDPPYNVAFQGSVHSDGKKSANSKYSSIANDKLSDEEWCSFLDKFISNYFSFCDGVLYICMSGKELHSLTESFIKTGGHWSNYIIWEKNNFTLSRKDFNSKYEPILYGWRDGVAHKYYGTNSEVDIWKIDRTKSNDLHPTMKPIELCSKAITLSTQGSNNIVMDLFLGSGSTLIASEKTGRICYGMELDPKYIDVIIQRYINYTGNNKIIKNGKEIIWESKIKQVKIK